ncbi:MAG: hypothetical protein CVT94_17445 [Bacteroidetes bacterium HGW-Bacteroidetes-11]|jgi:hypothetical protein|nr:MAG: hypothetical protein CVT94_17445 [Bacteroidetes bacterium HGW-Bacteroidetes-11]
MKTLSIKVLLISFLLFAAGSLIAQPPPPAGGQHNQQGDAPMGGNAPIGSGLLMLLSFSAAYGAKKVIQARNKQKNTNPEPML